MKVLGFQKMNDEEKREHSIRNSCENNFNARLKEHQVIMIRLLKSMGVNWKDISEIFHIPKREVYKISARDRWKRLLHRPGLYDLT